MYTSTCVKYNVLCNCLVDFSSTGEYNHSYNYVLYLYHDSQKQRNDYRPCELVFEHLK
jgi:hypothetical protein